MAAPDQLTLARHRDLEGRERRPYIRWAVLSLIGFFTLLYAESFSNPAALIALVLTLALLAVIMNELVRMVEARFSRWKE